MKYCLCWMFLLVMAIGGVFANIELREASEEMRRFMDPLECRQRKYEYSVTQSDINGKQCWDTISVTACWGHCDSNEITDWRFPFKKSTHPVCVHYGRNRVVATLRHCEEGALPMARHYEYLEAEGCRCQQCSSSDTSCEGLRYRPSRLEHIGFRD